MGHIFTMQDLVLKTLKKGFHKTPVWACLTFRGLKSVVPIVSGRAALPLRLHSIGRSPWGKLSHGPYDFHRMGQRAGRL